ncbi:MAG: 2-hydroxyacid dehydrogenase, partial [Hyphomicrobiales bacterium]
MKPALLLTGPMMPLIEDGVAAAFTVHRLHQAPDREAFLKGIAGDIEAICTGGHTGVKTDKALIERCPKLKVI